MNKLEKILELSKTKGFESLKDECERKDCRNCSCKQVIGACIGSFVNRKLLEEYEEPRKLTKRERAFCEYAQSGWIARDKDGVLAIYTSKPYKVGECWVCNSVIYPMFKESFPFIKWEDEEPYSVEELLTWEVED